MFGPNSMSLTPTPTSPVVNPPISPSRSLANRTGRRKSCNLCRLRKTRCDALVIDENTPLDVPLPRDKACRRCQVLKKPCIVQSDRRDGDQTRPLSSFEPSPNESQPTRTPTQLESGRGSDEVQPNFLESIKVFDPVHTQTQAQTSLSSSAHYIYPSTTPKQPSVLNYWGSPLRLTSTMLRSAYGETWQQASPSVQGRERELNFDLAGILLALDKSALASCFDELLGYHPHLSSFDTIAAAATSNPPDLGTSLLLAVVLYLCALVHSPSPVVHPAISALSPMINQWRQTCLLHAPFSNSAIMALDLLSFHAPFGTLPHQEPDSGAFEPATGQMWLSRQMIRVMTERSRARLDDPTAFDSPELWLEVSLLVSEANELLETDTLVHQSILHRAGEIYTQFTHPGQSLLWTSKATSTENSRMLGKLFWCEALGRLPVLAEANAEMWSMVVAGHGNFDGRVEQTLDKLDAIADRVDEILLSCHMSTSRIPPGWKAYREMLRQYNVGFVWRNAFRYRMATAYQNSVHIRNPSDLTINPNNAVLNALELGNRPSETLRFFQRSDESEMNAVQDLFMSRIESLERCLVAFAGIDTSESDTGTLLPWHRAIAIVLIASDIYMEAQAVHMTVSLDLKLLNRSFRVAQWDYLLDHVVKVMKHIEGTEPKTISSLSSKLVALTGDVSSRRRTAVANHNRHRSIAPPNHTLQIDNQVTGPSLVTDPLAGSQAPADFSLEWLLQSQFIPTSGFQPGDIPASGGIDDPFLRLLFGDTV